MQGSIYTEFFLQKTDCFGSFRVFSKKLKLKEKFLESEGKNIGRLDHFLAQFPFTASERELYHCHQRLNIRVV